MLSNRYIENKYINILSNPTLNRFIQMKMYFLYKIELSLRSYHVSYFP